MTKLEDTINNEKEFEYITGEKLKHKKTSEISSAGYVDDINHIASNKEIRELQIVTQDIHKLTRKIYNHNRLMVNDGKSQILQIESNTTEALNENRDKIEIINANNNCNRFFLNLFIADQYNVCFQYQPWLSDMCTNPEFLVTLYDKAGGFRRDNSHSLF